jgi:glycosyltransferase involved in cell wall biosynthesis
MGVPSDFFIHPNLKKNVSLDEFGYVGKATSSGSSNQLDVLVKEFQLAQSQENKLQLTMVGLEQSAIKTLEALQSEDTPRYRRMVFIGNVKHIEVINFLSKFYCGLLPYMDSEYNSMRFPIKLLEYAASSTHIIASDIKAHRDLLSDSQATFYNPKVKGSLAEAISYIRANEDEVDKKILAAYAWAENFSYENRARQALECISDLEMD